MEGNQALGIAQYFWAAITNNQGPSHWPGTSQDRAGPSPALLFPPKSVATVGRKTQGSGNSSTCPLSGNPMAPECHGGLTGVLKSELSHRPMPGAKSLYHHRAGQHLNRVTGTWLMVASRFRNGVSVRPMPLGRESPDGCKRGRRPCLQRCSQAVFLFLYNSEIRRISESRSRVSAGRKHGCRLSILVCSSRCSLRQFTDSPHSDRRSQRFGTMPPWQSGLLQLPV